ncbi:hypothetical protein Aple_050560 [Acrocarpospora pleiomorpha]|uniref:Uncharacterized protein n=1 Tax=Acrocarpospora pleiomorpha TaxID=90975 RepID=A0A5M3XQ11_9ACTN|nr:hypothetical protein Aple_050560 [Acrocarpospora pleiomorpha]
MRISIETISGSGSVKAGPGVGVDGAVPPAVGRESEGSATSAESVGTIGSLLGICGCTVGIEAGAVLLGAGASGVGAGVVAAEVGDGVTVAVTVTLTSPVGSTVIVVVTQGSPGGQGSTGLAA